MLSLLGSRDRKTFPEDALHSEFVWKISSLRSFHSYARYISFPPSSATTFLCPAKIRTYLHYLHIHEHLRLNHIRKVTCDHFSMDLGPWLISFVEEGKQDGERKLTGELRDDRIRWDQRIYLSRSACPVFVS